MELRQYWKVVQRRWLLLLVPALVVLVFGLLTYSRPMPGYNASVRFIVGQKPTSAANQADQERYYNWLTSEYIVNGLTDWVRGGGFAAAVGEHLAGQGLVVAPAEIQSGIAADNVRSLLTISLVHGDADRLAVLMQGVIDVLNEQNATALPQLGGETAVLVQLDQPVVTRNPIGLRSRLDLPLRLALALFAGLGLALLAEYLDPTIRDRADLELMGLPIMGEIPRK